MVWWILSMRGETMDNNYWLSNVLLESGFEYNNDKITGTMTNRENILIKDGRIAAVVIGGIPDDGIPVVDAKGLLALPSFYERHIHLDKGHYGGPWKACVPFTGVFDRIDEEKNFLFEAMSYTKERAEKQLDLIGGHGTTFARVHCNLDPVVGTGNIERVHAALQKYQDRLGYEIVAFPQHGLLRSDSISLMRAAMVNGARVVGGVDPASIDNNIEKSLFEMMDIAVEFDADLDIHLHDTGSLGLYTIKRLSQFTEQAKWQGRVNISHGYCLGACTSYELQEVVEILSNLGISIASTVPIDMPSPPVYLLQSKGVRVNLITDSLNDHWTPFGDGDLLRRASRMAEKFSMIDEYSLNRSLGFITNGIMPLDEKGVRSWPKVGDEASLILVDCSCSAEAVARVSKRKAVIYRGNLKYDE